MIPLILLSFLLLPQVVGNERCGIFVGNHDKENIKKLVALTGMKKMILLDYEGEVVAVGSHPSEKFGDFMHPHTIFQAFEVEEESKKYMLVEVMGKETSVVVVPQEVVKEGDWDSVKGRQELSDETDLDGVYYVVYLFSMVYNNATELEVNWSEFYKLELFHDRLDHFLFKLGMCENKTKGYFWIKFFKDEEHKDHFEASNASNLMNDGSETVTEKKGKSSVDSINVGEPLSSTMTSTVVVVVFSMVGVVAVVIVVMVALKLNRTEVVHPVEAWSVGRAGIYRTGAESSAYKANS